MKKFFVIPAIDLKDGRCVQLEQGHPEKVILSMEAMEAAERWVSEGASILHVIDLDGAFRSGKNFSLVKKIAGLSPIQLGGGIRSYQDAERCLSVAERIIVGTLAVKNPEIVEKLSDEYSPERIMVALDSSLGKVLVDGWRKKTNIRVEELAKKFERIVGSFLFTNVDVEGRLGVKMEPVKRLIKFTKNPVVVAGGISSIADIKEIRSSGAYGAVVGTALYKNRINLKEALKLQR